MTVHFSILSGQPLCGAASPANHRYVRCLDLPCAICEGNRDKVDCPICITSARELLSNVAYFFRDDGPHGGQL